MERRRGGTVPCGRVRVLEERPGEALLVKVQPNYNVDPNVLEMPVPLDG